jgi:hypothetical protein
MMLRLAQLGLMMASFSATASGASGATGSNKDKLLNSTSTPWAHHAQVENAQEFRCPTNATHLERQLILHLEGNDVQQMELSVLESVLAAAFLSTYNSWRFAACDGPYFRSVTAANLTVTPTTPAVATTESSVVITLAVQAMCHNCTENMPLFDLEQQPKRPPGTLPATVVGYKT